MRKRIPRKYKKEFKKHFGCDGYYNFLINVLRYICAEEKIISFLSNEICKEIDNGIILSLKEKCNVGCR